MRDFDKKVNALLKEEADKPWGDYAFASGREDVPFEPDTEEEAEAMIAVGDHLAGTSYLNKEKATIIKSLVKKGLYVDILELPADVDTVYRGMRIDPSDLIDLADEFDETSQDWQPIKATLKPRSSRATASWSVSYDAARKFAEAPDEDDFLIPVVFSARVSDNPGAFIINPDKVYNVIDWSELEQEQETIGVGPIKVSAIMLL